MNSSIFCDDLTYLNRRRSLKSEQPKLSKKYQQIISCLMNNGAMTAREIKTNLGLDDMNQVRPRITELIKFPFEIIDVVGSKVDATTRKKVSVFSISPRQQQRMINQERTKNE